MVLDLVAEFVKGRVCQGPSLSRAEFVMGRDVPESLESQLVLVQRKCGLGTLKTIQEKIIGST